MFNWLFDGIAGLLSFYFELTGSIGGSIILLTLTLLLLTAPLTMRSTRKMMRVQRDMQRIQPRMKQIQREFAGDRVKQNEELMKLYQEEGVSPFAALGGCFPMLLQAPIFIVLFSVLRGLGNVDAGKPDPKYLSSDTELYQKIRDAGGELVSWGFDLADHATSSHSSFVAALPYYVLIALVAVTGWFQMKQMAGRRAAAGQQQEVNPQQQMMQRIMPAMMPVFALGMPAGVVIYIVVSSMFRIGQQSLVQRLDFGSDSGGRSAAGKGAGKSAPAPRGGSAPEVDAGPGGTTSKPHPRSKKKRKKRSR